VRRFDVDDDDLVGFERFAIFLRSTTLGRETMNS
jgi:hypothetical protein